jgi:hypothetical protein
MWVSRRGARYSNRLPSYWHYLCIARILGGDGREPEPELRFLQSDSPNGSGLVPGIYPDDDRLLTGNILALHFGGFKNPLLHCRRDRSRNGLVVPRPV